VKRRIIGRAGDAGSNRYAGSRDRAAIRDIVFDCLRARRSLVHLGGDETGRAIVLAYTHQQGLELDSLFTGLHYDPEPVTDVERATLEEQRDANDPVRLNYPDFLDAEFGGGKALALFDAIKGQGAVVAHDIATVRMNDLPARAARAGARISIASPGHRELLVDSFDLVFVDAPCSGTGSWRRTPDAKWRFTPDDLENLISIQAEVLNKAATYVKAGGVLCYATCSFLAQENMDQIEAFLAASPEFSLEDSRLFTPIEIGDGFFAARMLRT